MIRFFFLACFYVVSLAAEDKITNHVVYLESGPLAYTATVGTLPVRDQEGSVKGEIGYTCYMKEGFAERPLTFAFNGGPGSSSVWLHVGTLGPRRILTPEEGQLSTPPYKIIDNLETLLDVTDLVFIDPIGTGISKANSQEDAKIFYDIMGDIHTAGDFIYDFITANKRWNSPKYLIGESYGTLRAAGLAEYLQNDHSMYLNGVILISCAIDFQTLFIDNNPDNQLPYLLSLPTYAATAHHHGRYRPEASMQEVAKDTLNFIYETYAPLLLRNSSLKKDEKEILYAQIAELTGLSYETVRRHNGKINDNFFIQEFLANEDKILGNYDTRLTTEITEQNKYDFSIDPSVSTIGGIVGGAFHNYLQKELDFSPSYYKILALEVNRNWNYFSRTPWGYPNLMDSLRNAMLVNPNLKIFVGSGYYDCVTPFAATDYCFDHLNLPDAYKSNIKMEYYEGGHMYYLSTNARIKFKQDLIDFYSQGKN
jgi:carboxypeptidase C (cathepsin A)